MNDLQSESKKTVNIWGRNCEINIVFDCFKEEAIDDCQKQAYDEFMKNWEKMMDSAYAQLEKYCTENYSEQIGGHSFDNIFKYIIPRCLYIQKTPDKTKIIGLLCKFKFDAENGIAVKFQNNKAVEVGGEQIAL